MKDRTLSPSPRVTVGMPVYNGERYLREALDAILGQSYADFELLISDNASDDGTAGICREYAAQDSRVRYRRQSTNLGAAPNYNVLVDMARGEYFRWAAHDDVPEPDLLEQLVGALDAAPGAVMAFSDTVIIDDVGDIKEHYVHRTPWHGGSARRRLADLLYHPQSYIHRCFPIFGLFRTEALKKSGRIGSFEGSDTALLLELALMGDFVHVPEYLFRLREHAASSRQAQVTASERDRWFDTRETRRVLTPRATLARHYAVAVARAPIGIHERVGCGSVLARWLMTGRRWRVIAGEYRAALGARTHG